MHGWPLLVHYCDDCHYNTTINYSPTVWIEYHTCSFCGTSSPGADVAGRSSAEMNQYQHDELARMFTQNMQLSQTIQNQAQQQQIQQPVAVESILQPSEKQAEQQQSVHFVSTHYTGTAHLRPSTTSEASNSPPPPYHEALMPEAMYSLLREHSIDPSSLLPNQIHLFANANNEQKLRLLELWRIAPPSYPLEEHMNSTWITTSVEREEALARVRYEQQQRQLQQPPEQQQGLYSEEHMLDTHIPKHFGRPPPSSVSFQAQPQETRQSEAEPYIANGYSALSGPDPVYAAAVDLWQAPSYAQAMLQQQQGQQSEPGKVGMGMGMEDQYGMYEQVRNHADWEALNELLARERTIGIGGGGDCEMEL